MEPRLINVNDLDRYRVTINGHRYVPWMKLADVPTAAIPLAYCRHCAAKIDGGAPNAKEVADHCKT